MISPPAGAPAGARARLPVGPLRRRDRRAVRGRDRPVGARARRGDGRRTRPSSTRGSPRPPTAGPPTGSASSSAARCGSRSTSSTAARSRPRSRSTRRSASRSGMRPTRAARLVNGILGRIQREEAVARVSADDSLEQAEELLDRARGGPRSGSSSRASPEQAIEVLAGARRAREADRGRAAARAARGRGRCRGRLRSCAKLVEGYLAELELAPVLGSLAEPIRYALGGKRVRPVLCLAAGRGGRRRARAGCCRPRPRSSSCTPSRSSTTTCRRSTTTRSAAGRRASGRRYGEATAILAGDALARRGVPARALRAGADVAARARRRDARDDRRPAARPRGRRMTSPSCTG